VIFFEVFEAADFLTVFFGAGFLASVFAFFFGGPSSSFSASSPAAPLRPIFLILLKSFLHDALAFLEYWMPRWEASAL